VFLVASAIYAFAENPEMAMDKMSDDELRAFREQKIAELKQHVQDARPEQTSDGAIYSQIFFCAIYYTPKESGFTSERGFDATPVRASTRCKLIYIGAKMNRAARSGGNAHDQAAPGWNMRLRWK
jgi:hypothetical protein